MVTKQNLVNGAELWVQRANRDVSRTSFRKRQVSLMLAPGTSDRRGRICSSTKEKYPKQKG